MVQVEYDVESCSASGMADNRCTDSKRISLVLPTGGYIVYGVAHQHSGGIGSALYGEVIQHLPFLFVAIWVQHFLISLLSSVPVMISCEISYDLPDLMIFYGDLSGIVTLTIKSSSHTFIFSPYFVSPYIYDIN